VGVNTIDLREAEVAASVQTINVIIVLRVIHEHAFQVESSLKVQFIVRRVVLTLWLFGRDLRWRYNRCHIHLLMAVARLCIVTRVRFEFDRRIGRWCSGRVVVGIVGWLGGVIRQGYVGRIEFALTHRGGRIGHHISVARDRSCAVHWHLASSRLSGYRRVTDTRHGLMSDRCHLVRSFACSCAVRCSWQGRYSTRDGSCSAHGLLTRLRQEINTWRQNGRQGLFGRSHSRQFLHENGIVNGLVVETLNMVQQEGGMQLDLIEINALMVQLLD
jgi:hypothetical protein